MGGLAFIFPFFCCALFGIIGSNAFNISPKIFNINEMGSCPENNEMQMQYNGTTRALPQRNKYLFNGTIVVLADIGGPIELRTRTQRCSLDMTHCEDFDTSTFRNVCAQILQKNTMWAEAISNTHPKFGCPFRKGTYKLKDSTIDLSALSRLPFDGYTWILYMRFFAIKNREKIPTFCIRFEITVSLAKGKQTNHK